MDIHSGGGGAVPFVFVPWWERVIVDIYAFIPGRAQDKTCATTE